MTIHVLGSRVSYDVGTPLERAAVDRSSESVVHNERYTVLMSDTCKLLNIQHVDAWIRNRFTEKRLGIRLECLLDFFFRCVDVHECTFDAEFLHGYGKKIECTAIDSRSTYEVVACLADVEDRIEVGSLSRRSKHSAYTTFQRSNLGCYGIVGRVLQASIEITGVFEVEQTSHLFAGIIFESGTLINREHTRLALGRLPSTLNTKGGRTEIFLFHISDSLFCQFFIKTLQK